MTIHAERVLETCLYAEDLEAAERFYTFMLGHGPFTKHDGRHVFFKCGDGVLLIFNPRSTADAGGPIPPHGARGPGHMAWAMREEDTDAWRKRLAEGGIEIETEFEWPNGGFSIYFRDPAGNSIELATPKMWGLE